jgi:hypothetical protein
VAEYTAQKTLQTQQGFVAEFRVFLSDGGNQTLSVGGTKVAQAEIRKPMFKMFLPSIPLIVFVRRRSKELLDHRKINRLNELDYRSKRIRDESAALPLSYLGAIYLR